MSGSPPDGLSPLVQRHHGQHQPPVPFIVDSWKRALAAHPDEAGVVEDERWTVSGKPGRRTVDRAALTRLTRTTDLADPVAVRRAFVLITVWGSGTTNTRSYRNLPTALAAPNCTNQLVETALACRRGDLETAYSSFSLPGMQRSFFTKWFAFAGRAADRPWQPLILDRRVLNTLNRTLALRTTTLAGDRRWSRRYAAYVQHLHAWGQTVGCSAERLEWILFTHNGEPLDHD